MEKKKENKLLPLEAVSGDGVTDGGECEGRRGEGKVGGAVLVQNTVRQRLELSEKSVSIGAVCLGAVGESPASQLLGGEGGKLWSRRRS